jgi:beta-lactamase class A
MRLSADLRSVRASLPSVSTQLPSIPKLAPQVPTVAPSPTIAVRLLDDLRLVAAASPKTKVGVVVIDLRGSQPRRIVELNGDRSFVAASTYKFPLLMANAERIAEGTVKSSDRMCFHPSQAESGWFEDYDPGECFTRQTIAARAGTYSDNTAGHMLVDNLGGATALNSYARSRGAAQSSFYYPNQTTASDLAALWTTEAQGRAGGRRAQQWLYPLLTKTAFEDGIPAGVPASARVVHKIGAINTTLIDAGVVIGPKGQYVVAIALEGLPGDAGWALIARFSKVVWQYQAR